MNGDSNKFTEQNMRQPTIPCLEPKDKLIERYTSMLEIRAFGKKYPIVKNTNRGEKKVATQVRFKSPPNKEVKKKKEEEVKRKEERAKPQPIKRRPSVDDFKQVDLIDTNNLVDDTMIAFLPEFCQRVKLSPVPEDPLDVCKKFRLELANCEIYKCLQELNMSSVYQQNF